MNEVTRSLAAGLAVAVFGQWGGRKLRRLAVHLQERWRQMTLHQREPGVPNTTNWLEGRFGRIKPRYRLTRGLKSVGGR